MLIQEAKWFGEIMSRMKDSEIFPMLNVGSHTEAYRKDGQPWVQQYIFAEAERRKQTVMHLDIVDGPGVDIVGDLTDGTVLKRLAKMGFRSVLCTNVLEHVMNRGQVAQGILEIVPVGGYLFVSVPYRFPYHPDPIDTMFRPNVTEIVGLFPGTTIYRQEIVRCGTLLGYLVKRMSENPRRFAKRLRRRLGGTPGSDNVGGWPSTVGLLSWMFREFQVTCVVLQKASGAV